MAELESDLDDIADNSKVTEATKDKKIEAVDVFECAISQQILEEFLGMFQDDEIASDEDGDDGSPLINLESKKNEDVNDDADASPMILDHESEKFEKSPHEEVTDWGFLKSFDEEDTGSVKITRDSVKAKVKQTSSSNVSSVPLDGVLSP